MQTSEPTAELRENVHGDEEIQWVVRAHGPARFASEGAGAVIFGLIGAGMFGAVAFAATGAVFGAGPVPLLAAVGAGAVVLALSVRKPLGRFLLGTTEYAGTDQRLIKYEGYFGRSASSVPLAGVQDAEFEISGTEKFFDVGTVTVDTERGYESMSFPYTPSPQAFSREVSSLAAGARKQERSPGRSGPTGEYTPGESLATDDPVDGLEENVYPDEQLLWVTTPNRKLTLLRSLPGLLMGAVFVALFAGGFAFAAVGETAGVEAGALAGVAVGGSLVVLIVGASAWWTVRSSTQYAATDRRIVEYDGRFGRHLSSIPLAAVQDAEYSISTVENAFSVGSVSLDTDRGYETMTLSSVEDPPAVATEISRLAASGIADRDAVDPGQVSVGEEIDSRSPTSDLEAAINDNERLTWVIRPDKSARLLANVVGSVPAVKLFAGFFGVFVAVGIFAATENPILAVLGMIGFVLVMLSPTVLGPASAYMFGRTEYALTDDRLIEYSGTFGRELSSVPLAGIQDAEYDVSTVESYFGVGDVTVDTDPDYDSFSLKAVANPVAVAREISEIANAYRVATATAGGSTTASDAEPARGAGGDAAVPSAQPRKRCRECSEAIDVAASFCPSCGSEQPRPDRAGTAECRQCDGPVAPDDGFCRSCGTREPAS